MIEKTKSRIRFHAIFIVAILFVVDLSMAQADESDLAAVKTVVIDAGHGGKDPGCHGASAKEKHVCLSMALMLGTLIEQNYPDIKVIYTRDTDVFVELSERAKIANRNNADLFICIHANAASARAFGTETFVLGLHRTDSQLRVAERENSIIHLEDDGGAKYENFDLSPDAIIARQIQLSVFLDQSINFASKIQTEFKSIGRFDRGVKQAGFLVLYKTTMPSVLIETGFLTNPKEEKFLNNKDSQQNMASSIFKAFVKYKNELEGVKSTTDGSTVLYIPYNNETESEVVSKDDVIFRVQIKTSERKIPLTSSTFAGVEVFEYEQNGLYKYTVGAHVNDYESANSTKKKMRKKGFEHAFVVAFLGAERINLQKAINLAEKREF